ncbi:hypothetical protein CK203_084015 [Vitis vinifera]|uniref:Uncharacterized protein n=1 Tax=Vitis vinifera TaxID=29760 RepID=A0A438EUQ8_VITVI|nr:hypothetical protein CK203_084015 [Vitis vinifera]
MTTSENDSCDDECKGKEWKKRDKMKYQGKSVQRRCARCSSIATTQGCRIFLEDILKGKLVERRFRLTSGWATGLPLLFWMAIRLLMGCLNPAYELWVT